MQQDINYIYKYIWYVACIFLTFFFFTFFIIILKSISVVLNKTWTPPGPFICFELKPFFANFLPVTILVSPIKAFLWSCHYFFFIYWIIYLSNKFMAFLVFSTILYVTNRNILLYYVLCKYYCIDKVFSFFK